MSEIRVMPLPKVTGVWRHDCSRYPDEIRIPMSDGKIVRYHIDTEMPHPCFEAAMKNLSNMKKTGDCCSSHPAKGRTMYSSANCSTEREEK